MATLFWALIPATLRSTTPLLLTALGGMYSERSGVVNIALEGIILFGALAAAVTTQRLEASLLAQTPAAQVGWIPWVGLLAGALGGVAIAFVHALMCIRYRADQIVSGTAINLLAMSVPSLVLQSFYGNTTNSQEIVNRLPLWHGFSPLVYLAFLLVPISWWLLFKTPWGLRLRAVGEHPQAAATMGVDVLGMRYAAVLLSGLLEGLAGAYLSIGFLNQFVRNMSAGKGLIALAAMIFGKWHPFGILGATLLFGATDALAIQLQGGDVMPPVLIQALPFVLTMGVLSGMQGRARRTRPPAALGKIYSN
ncbi:ABC transporter permease [Synechococcus sp. R55.7]|uniref:ABC transporter permease n=1 Tax=Synechococcus sp. R55.7 TaxID=2964500 RepID=UPI0039C0CD10